MSNLYTTEPNTNGKVIFDTTAGEIEVELWSKEAPKAVRNFLQLSMEGYYDNVIFHRVVAGFIIQSGDPSGTGMGGESIYGEPFEDEIHGRLRFNRRGLLGMANRGKRNTNTSQFFFTLDRAEELTGKHTVFGKIVGNTVFNVLNIGQMDVDAEERPVRPPKIRGIRIVENPFEDIVPRITAAERKAQQQARIDAKRDLEAREKKVKAKKNTGLLSFGEAEELPAESSSSRRKKGMGREDLLDAAPPAPTPVETFVDLPPSLADLGKEEKRKVDLKSIRKEHQRQKEGDSEARQAEIAKMQESLRALKRRAGEGSDSDSDDGRRRKGPSYLEQELAKYQKGRGRAARGGGRRGKREEEEDLLGELSKFSQRVTALQPVSAGDDRIADLREGKLGESVTVPAVLPPDPAPLPIGEPEPELEVDDDVGWMAHSLKFHVDEKELVRRAEEEYDVIDSRAKGREIAAADAAAKVAAREAHKRAADLGRR